jgi:hypothetical protein
VLTLSETLAQSRRPPDRDGSRPCLHLLELTVPETEAHGHGGTFAWFASRSVNASRSWVPFVEVVYDSTITEPMLRQLAELLPALVAEAVACPEEPDAGPPEPGDLEIRFRPKGPFDVGELNCAIELRARLYASRLETRQDRAELVKAGLSKAFPGIRYLGVWLVLAEGWWTQT